jgi:predicted nucleic acid-binding protein
MRKIRVYVDTSVFGGALDEEFAEASLRFFHRVERGEFVVLLSTHTLDELAPAPEQVLEVLQNLPKHCVETISAGDEAETLANAYIQAGALGKASRMDALHVASATVAGADLILSWNFKHIVCYDRIQLFNGVNILQGYRALDIRSPLEMRDDDENKDI